MILKYIHAKSGEYICSKTGEILPLPLGYAPEKDSLWTPATTGSGNAKKNYWIDPAMGEDFNRTAPFLLMYDPGEKNGESAGPVQVYRAVEPPPNVMDLIVILKTYTNGLFAMKIPETIKQLWINITEGIRRSDSVEKMVWNKLPDAKFGFRIRNLFQIDPWKGKTTFQLVSQDKHLGITKAQLTSGDQAIGYDLSKIEGYDPDKIVTENGWTVIKENLMNLMHTEEFKKLNDKLKVSGRKMSNNRMKMLAKAANGEEI